MSARGERQLPAALEQTIRSFLRERLGPLAEALDVAPLAGDASTRLYYRVVAASGERWVVAQYEGPFDGTRSPFVVVQRLLSAWGLPVPAVAACDGARGLVLLEDLGDCTLEQRLTLASTAEREALYQEALDQLVRMQRAAAAARSDADCFRLAFDSEKLQSELAFFVGHFLEGLNRCRLTAAARAELDAGFRELCDEIASWPRVLCHRDYHARNLMWRDGHLHWVDFQDARMGPVTYDAASLLRDSYVDLEEGLVAARLEEYRRAVSSDESARSFGRRFELTCLQRNLKALGTFGYQATVRGKRQYLASVPRTLAHVRRNLSRHPSLGRVAAILAEHVAELRGEVAGP